jgi:hypothetical protein
MSQFVGTWKLDRSTYQNFDAFWKETGIYKTVLIFHLYNSCFILCITVILELHFDSIKACTGKVYIQYTYIVGKYIIYLYVFKL